MRVLQIIDTLDAGGAERMAVHYANLLSERIPFSGIVVTRRNGVLSNQLVAKVPSFILNKKKAVDFKAVGELKNLIIKNEIEVLHVHGTSFFTAFLLKIIYWKIKIVYHEHYGGRAKQGFFKNFPLLFSCLFFSRILVVNNELVDWFQNKGFQKTIFFRNFAIFSDKEIEKTVLKGENNKRIIYLANLKEPKNHLVLLKAFSQLDWELNGWTLHLVGKNFNDAYFEMIKTFIQEAKLDKSVFVYDSKSDIKNILSQAQIGVLCSTFEGFPVTLLEYGLAGLSVVSSNLNYCSGFIVENKTGLLFESNNENELATKLQQLIEDSVFREKLADAFNKFTVKSYSKEIVMTQLIELYKKVL